MQLLHVTPRARARYRDHSAISLHFLALQAQQTSTGSWQAPGWGGSSAKGLGIRTPGWSRSSFCRQSLQWQRDVGGPQLCRCKAEAQGLSSEGLGRRGKQHRTTLCPAVAEMNRGSR